MKIIVDHIKNSDESFAEARPQEEGDVKELTAFRVPSAAKTPRPKQKQNTSYS